ncbi:M23 family metallopeptidase [Lusitaniella coriacea LEGE 07157]|uniref:M23 family metallopeptidase n=1 Tax=Lusitaniella coriacea LEGE 07157 TaxID=945747 RepID=A0A8J7B7G7_9CYAN|nr:M23 family metallopeptidase [Lusitaniella coriacea]MBE9115369.1 M23 family metallopeptidase [Lusitaniella coriacea LEGE 07157]
MELLRAKFIPVFTCILFLTGLILPVASREKQIESVCQTPVLSRLQRHRVSSGETLETIARQYNLIPETLTRLNPSLSRGSAPVGREILIPPFNGIRIQAPRGSTWQDLEKAYGVRADILFEINGCERTPTTVFIPGVNWSSAPKEENYTGLTGYPLREVGRIIIPYGWYDEPLTSERRFHSGIDILADSGTPVLAAESGVVAFVGQQGNYGNLIVINHSGGRQTRYAHLSQVNLQPGQQVQGGSIIGAVGMTGKPDIAAPHLHFEVRHSSPQGWVAQDPEIHLR